MVKNFNTTFKSEFSTLFMLATFFHLIFTDLFFYDLAFLDCHCFPPKLKSPPETAMARTRLLS